MKEEGREWPKEAKKIKDGGEKKDSSAGGLILFAFFCFFGYSRRKAWGRMKDEG